MEHFFRVPEKKWNTSSGFQGKSGSLLQGSREKLEHSFRIPVTKWSTNPLGGKCNTSSVFPGGGGDSSGFQGNGTVPGKKWDTSGFQGKK